MNDLIRRERIAGGRLKMLVLDSGYSPITSVYHIALGEFIDCFQEGWIHKLSADSATVSIVSSEKGENPIELFTAVDSYSVVYDGVFRDRVSLSFAI